MSRRTIITFTVTALMALIVSSGALAATTTPSAKPTTSSFALSVDNNIVVHKDAPNLQFWVVATNNTSASASCHLYVEELGYTSETFDLASNSQTGFGTAFPNSKRSTLTIDLVCNDGVVATAISKVTMTGQAG
jgi:hypothetical protein